MYVEEKMITFPVQKVTRLYNLGCILAGFEFKILFSHTSYTLHETVICYELCLIHNRYF